jgi:hypothetical protein
LLYLLGAVAVVVAALVWLYTGVARGARRRDEAILTALAPLLDRLQQGAPVSQEEVAEAAAIPQQRVPLYPILKELGRLDLFPAPLLDESSQGAARLAYWMIHPNELGGPPAALEPVEIVNRQLAGESRRFHVYRYRMPPGHWAERHGWMLGVAGPFADGDPPYLGPHGAFSRAGDKHGEVQPSALVDWYIDICRKKGAPW